MNRTNQKIIFIISIFIHFFYYISAYFTHTLDIFFEHFTMGQDFFQIPNAAYSFLRGGTLTGSPPLGLSAYTNCCGVNSNVYHPLFTLLIGLPLQLLEPWRAFAAWGFLHFGASVFIVYFFWKRFKNHKYIYLALSFYLLNSYHYYEIQHAQYHFLLSFLTIIFIYEITTQTDTKKASLWYFLSLLVKPIGLLWAIPLLIYKKYMVLFWGVGLYVLFSLPFILLPFGRYFFSNIYSVMGQIFPTYNLYSLIHVVPIPIDYIKLFSYFSLFCIITICYFKKPPIFTLIFALTSYQLTFYPLTFHYQYSMLAGLFMLGVIFGMIKNVLGYIAIIFLTIPTPIVFFHLAGYPPNLAPREYSLNTLWSIFWVILLTVTLLFQKYEKIH